MKLLNKIAWKTRRWNFKIQFLNIYLHDGDGTWGFDILTILKDYHSYSLLSILFRLPNGADVKELVLDDLDFLFLRSFLYNIYDDLDDRKLWGSQLTPFEEFKLNLLGKLFK